MNSLLAAFALYSRIPVREPSYEPEKLRYIMCFFPLVGAACGLILIAAGALIKELDVPAVFGACILTAVPVFFTGGIHLDGFMDTCDALASLGDTKKKLSVLKDPHTGAFAVISCCLLFLLEAGSYSVLSLRTIAVVGAGFILSRSFSGFAAVSFKNARGDGMLYSFTESADLKTNKTALIIWAAVGIVFMVLIRPVCGLTAAAAAFIFFVYYRRRAYAEFGGITGDLEGWFLTICEALIAVVCALAECIIL